jgi:hypothetical protein
VAAVGHSALGQYSSATSRVLSTVDKTADFWTQGAQTLTDRLPGLPQIDLIRPLNGTSISCRGR